MFCDYTVYSVGLRSVPRSRAPTEHKEEPVVVDPGSPLPEKPRERTPTPTPREEALPRARQRGAGLVC